jgi:hypothetical protein
VDVSGPGGDDRAGSAPDRDRTDEEGRHQELLDVIAARSRRTAILYMVAGVVLIPWTVYLAVTLPKRELDTHYRGAWVGFDLLLVTAIIMTGYYAFRLDSRVQIPAAATATLLIVDAWFDVMTAGSRQSTFEAALMALCIEIPAAFFSLFLARRVNQHVEEIEEIKKARHRVT